MPRLYDETQDFHPDAQYGGEYAMCSVSKRTCNGAVKRQNINYADISTCYATTFLLVYIEDELAARHVPWIHKISLMSLIDAMAAILFIEALKTVHLHPAITIAHLFSWTTSWYQCIFIVIVQLIATITANISIIPLRNDGLPAYITVNSDINTEWTRAIYKLMFSQFFGTALVVVAHLMSYSSSRRSRVRIGRLRENSCSLFTAISLSSFLSLLQSSSHWNSLQATTVSLLRSFSQNASEPLHDQYIFWLGPLIGSLLACFLYRLLSPATRHRSSSAAGYCEDVSDSI
ncbi:hypothetical protein OESDEN_01357 [Oesophagostomum dentatum]|uniref:Transmembrane protein n=1 Tax=Oesophagostomum dentatum TaxID=61180 RepID=A0A0B1TTE6_OESDE|nr:hypothetical protein OESDEN_01357 [Oesophagostomum dentatum]